MCLVSATIWSIILPWVFIGYYRDISPQVLSVRITFFTEDWKTFLLLRWIFVIHFLCHRVLKEFLFWTSVLSFSVTRLISIVSLMSEAWFNSHPNVVIQQSGLRLFFFSLYTNLSPTQRVSGPTKLSWLLITVHSYFTRKPARTGVNFHATVS